MGSDPKFLLSNIEISRITWRRGAQGNELVVDVHIEDIDIELEDRVDTSSMKTMGESFISHVHDYRQTPSPFGTPLCGSPNPSMLSLNPYLKNQRSTASLSRFDPTSRPGSKDNRGKLHASRVGVYEPRPEYKDLGFKTYGYKRRS